MGLRSAFKAKIASISSSISGVLGFLGGYQVCHNVCLGIIALLSLIGITFVGMPLFFLTKVAVPFWIAALFLFLISSVFYFKNKCISKNFLLFNGGILLVGIPFQILEKFFPVFWIVGVGVIVLGLTLFLKDKMVKNRM